MFMPHSAGCLLADTHQMAFSGQRPQLLPSVAYAPSGTPVGEIQPHRAISDGHYSQGWRDRSRGQPLRDKFFVQPMTAVVAPPNLSAHKPASNCASGNDDRPYMPSPCRCWAFAQSKGEANGGHSWAFNPPPTTKVTNNRFYDHAFNPSATRSIED